MAPVDSEMLEVCENGLKNDKVNSSPELKKTLNGALVWLKIVYGKYPGNYKQLTTLFPMYLRFPSSRYQRRRAAQDSTPTYPSVILVSEPTMPSTTGWA